MRSLKGIFWTETFLTAVACVSAVMGLWGIFAAIAFISIMPVLWLIAFGIAAHAVGIDAFLAIALGESND